MSDPLTERTASKNGNEVLWVILTKTYRPLVGTTKYSQWGPYPADYVKGLIHQGKIRYTDYAWCEGMKRWVRISSLTVFNPQAREPETTSKGPEKLELEDVWAHVEYQQKDKTFLEKDEPPAEAGTHDLAQVGQGRTLRQDLLPRPQKAASRQKHVPKIDLSSEAAVGGRAESAVTKASDSNVVKSRPASSQVVVKRLPWRPFLWRMSLWAAVVFFASLMVFLGVGL